MTTDFSNRSFIDAIHNNNNIIGADNIGYDGVIALAESLWATPL